MPADAPTSIALETAGRVGHIALGLGDQCVAQRDIPRTRQRNLELVPTLDALLREHKLGPADLDECYVALGPGSFTGLRMAIATAQMLALAQPALKLVGVPTLDVLALQHKDAAEHVAVMLNLKRGTSYCATYRAGDCILEPAIRTTDELLAQSPRPLALVAEIDPGLPTTSDESLTSRDRKGVGPTRSTAAPLPHGRGSFNPKGATELHWLDPADTAPDPAVTWQLGHALARAGQFTDPPQLLPRYIREPEAVTLWEQQGKG
ncbi:tRNA (adenosine(37)-N6)-threonylcarbamoyltransferase complex dimerization subunit type 1 TsaB [Phycisphaeraceae bacterium D3-23]